MKNDITNFSINAFISIKNLLNIYFNHILKEANFTNNVVAKIGHSLQDGQVWDKELPLMVLLAFNIHFFIFWMPKELFYQVS